MSLVGSIDAIATKVGNVTGIKKAYAVGADSDVRPIPRGIDDTPVATVYLTTWEANTGNAENLLATVRVDIWAAGDNPGWAIKTLSAFVDLVRNAIRTDMNLGGECTRSSILGGSGFEPEEVNGRPYLVLPIDIEVYTYRFGSDATA